MNNVSSRYIFVFPETVLTQCSTFAFYVRMVSIYLCS